MHNPFEIPRLVPQASPSAQIEDYLDHLCAPLVGKTTYEQRLTIRQEVRSHLLVLALAHEELGSTPVEAIQAAIHQFGNARKIGGTLAREYHKPFALNGQLCWVLLHAAIGGAVGSMSFITMDLTLQRMGLFAHTAVSVDCLLGMATGWIPALQFLKHPASPLRAAMKMGGFYTLTLTGIEVAIGLLTFPNPAFGHKFDGQALRMISTGIFLLGASAAGGGGAMSLIFRRLQRFAPQTQPERALPNLT